MVRWNWGDSMMPPPITRWLRLASQSRHWSRRKGTSFMKPSNRTCRTGADAGEDVVRPVEARGGVGGRDGEPRQLNRRLVCGARGLQSPRGRVFVEAEDETALERGRALVRAFDHCAVSGEVVEALLVIA